MSDETAIPQTTPQGERQRLVAKGRLLVEHCLAGGGTACVLGFVEHCLGKSPPQLDVVTELWRELQREGTRAAGAGESADAPRRALLGELLQAMGSRISAILKDD